MRIRQIFILFLLLATSTLWGQVKTTEATSLSRVVQDTMTGPKDTAMSPKERRQAKSGRIPTVRSIDSNFSLSHVEVRWGWSVLSDDGTFLQNPLRFDNWENVTLRPLPVSLSVHFPFRVNKTGSHSQLGIQSFYSASEALWIAGNRNYGTAHYYSINADFRTNFRKISWLGNSFSPHINCGLGYTYRSVALYKHEPILHLGLGGTFWLTERWGITAAGTGHFGMLHWLYGHASYLQANLYGVYRF